MHDGPREAQGVAPFGQRLFIIRVWPGRRVTESIVRSTEYSVSFREWKTPDPYY